MKRNIMIASSVVSLAAAMVVSPVLAQGPICLEPAVQYPEGPWIANPISVVAADLDGDGDADLATTTNLTGGVSVLLNNGGATFAAPITYGAIQGPLSIAAADLDSDGDIDLATSNEYAWNISVLFNHGNGTFAPAVSYSTSAQSQGVALADLDGDGDIDLATSNNDGTITVMLNAGDGTFAAPINYGATVNAISMTAADLDRDGDIDLVTANAGVGPAGIAVLLNNGNGTFGAATSYPTLGGALCATAADVDGDSDLDLIACENIFVFVLRNNGDGTFAPFELYFATYDFVTSVTAADLDGDGAPELVAAAGYYYEIAVLPNNGDGTYGELVTYSVGNGPFSSVAADLDGDRDLDLAVANSAYPGGAGSVAVMINCRETPDAPPTAAAGVDQSVRAGTLVTLDGSASFDDNTPTGELIYEWSLAKPAGSASALDDAASVSPTFLVDLPGTYIATLVVRDGLGQASASDEVIVSSANLAPTADAGPDRVVIVGDLVTLSAALSSDPEMDALTYQWTLIQAPAGSIVGISGDQNVACLLQPDLPGSYILELIVDDGLGPSPADTVLVTAITGQQFAENAVMTAAAIAAALPPASVTTTGNQNAFGNFLRHAIDALQSGDLDAARHWLNKAIERTDGCALRGAPDPSGPARDWFVDCPSQLDIYIQLAAALDAISP